MKISEILVKEAYIDELNKTIMNLIAIAKSDNLDEIPTRKLRKMLSKEGYLLSTRELLTVLDDLNIVRNADNDSIKLNGEPDVDLPDLDQLPDVSDQEPVNPMDQDVLDADDTSDEIVSDLATKQALRSIR